MRAIDLFAGAGGFTLGAQRAGADVLWAANHWPEAVQAHATNHPNTIHSCQDLRQADFTNIPDHDILMASPACQGHARARGQERPHHDALRSTAWAVIAAVEAKHPTHVLVENVPEFTSWALYPVWRQALTTYGYHVTEHVLNASDFGVPQQRKRVFVLASKHKHEIAPPRNNIPTILQDVVDFNVGRWSPIDQKVPATRDQARRAQEKHGSRCAIVYNGSRNAGRPLNQPAPTITTVDRIALLDDTRMRMLTIDECKRIMGFPETYQLARRKKDSLKLLGNAVCPPVAEHIIRQLTQT
jgi:DNA (cytosine-5)-methyltransferase 1